MRKQIALALLAAALPAGGASAAGFYDRYVLGPDGIPPCYARVYDRDHLAGHPRQKVTHFFVTYGEDDTGRPPKSFDMAFGFLLKGSRDVFTGLARCMVKGDGAACLVEGDGGAFTLTPRPDGLLVSVNGRLEIEGVDSFSPDLHESDDRDFRLYASTAELCVFDIFGERSGASPIEPLAPSIER